VVQRSEGPQGPPHPRLALAKLFLESVLDLGLAARSRCKLQEIRNDRVGVGGRQPSRGIAAIVQARRPQAADHRVVKRWVVLREHRVQRQPDQRCLDHGSIRERRIKVGRVEVGQPVPEGQVGRRRLLCLESDDPAHGLDHVKCLAAEEQLPAQRGPVELPAGQGHGGILSVTSRGSATGQAVGSESRR
jgi:hypothetical protein